MTTLTSLALIVLILLDMYIFKQLDKHEIGIAELLRISCPPTAVVPVRRNSLPSWQNIPKAV